MQIVKCGFRDWSVGVVEWWVKGFLLCVRSFFSTLLHYSNTPCAYNDPRHNVLQVITNLCTVSSLTSPLLQLVLWLLFSRHLSKVLFLPSTPYQR
jgi:hypothetical protein